MKKIISYSIIFLLSFVFLITLALAQANVSTCGTLNTANEFYQINTSITSTGTCFTIAADNITLNGMGYSVLGDNVGLDYGIFIDGFRNLTLKNLNISQFNRAIQAVNVTPMVIYNNTFSRQEGTYTIYLQSVNYSTISYNQIFNTSTTQLFITNSMNDTVIYNSFARGYRAIDLDVTSNSNLSYNNITQISNVAIWMSSGKPNNYVGYNNITFVFDAIDTESAGGDNCTAEYNYIQNASNTAFLLSNSMQTIRHNYVRNGLNGIVGSSDNAYIWNNTFINFAYGFDLRDSNTVLFNRLFNITDDSLDPDGVNNLFQNNIIETYTDTGNDGIIWFGTGANNNTLINNTVKSNGKYNINFRSSSRNYLIDTFLSNYTSSAAGGLMTFQYMKWGRIDYLQNINGSGQNLSSDIQIKYNFIFVNSTNNIGLNRSANITLYNIPKYIGNVKILKDGNICTDCSNFTSLSAENVSFNVSSFSNYTVYSNQIAISTCGILNASDTTYFLENSVSTTGNCFTIQANNITLDGQGYNIDGDDVGTDYGVYSNGFNSSTIMNTNITDFGAGGGSAIQFDNGKNHTVINNTVSSGYDGIVFLTTFDSNASYNKIIFMGHIGLYLNQNKGNNYASYNNISSSVNQGLAAGFAGGENGVIEYNYIENTSNGYALYLSNGNQTIRHNYLKNNLYGLTTNGGTISYNNTIINSSTGLENYGSNNLFYNDKILNSTDDAIQIWSDNSLYYNLTVEQYEDGSDDGSIILEFDIKNNTIYDTKFKTDNKKSFSLNSPNRNYIVNTFLNNYTIGDLQDALLTFWNVNYGKIDFLSTVTGSGLNLSDDIRIGSNSIFVNSSSNTGLNVSANITLYNIPTTYSNYSILKDGVLCTDCYNLTAMNAGTVKFNVTSWSNYSILYTGVIIPEATTCSNILSGFSGFSTWIPLLIMVIVMIALVGMIADGAGFDLDESAPTLVAAAVAIALGAIIINYIVGGLC